MAKQTTYTCDSCGAVKKETNHWFLLVLQGYNLQIIPWDENDQDLDRLIHCCGDACVVAKVQEFLKEQQKRQGA